MAYEFRMVETNGVRIRAAVEGSGPLVVMVHGWPESWYSWRHQMAPLAAAGYTACAIDVRGYGGSDKPYPVEDYDMASVTGDVERRFSVGRGRTVKTRTMVRLTTLPRNATGTVAGVRVHAPGVDGTLDAADERMALRLIEIGFVQGASLRVIAFGQPGDDPIGVRVGGRGGVSTFALRRAEAACVWVWLDEKR